MNRKFFLPIVILFLCISLAFILWLRGLSRDQTELPHASFAVSRVDASNLANYSKLVAPTQQPEAEIQDQTNSEKITNEERERIDESLQIIERDLKSMELQRTTVLKFSADGSFSDMEVLIKSPTEAERKIADANSSQGLEGLTPAAEKQYKDKIKQLKDKYLFDEAARYVKMTTPGEDWAEQRIATVVGFILNPELFINDFASGTHRVEMPKISFGGEPKSDWRYSHIFRMSDPEDSASNAQTESN